MRRRLSLLELEMHDYLQYIFVASWSFEFPSRLFRLVEEAHSHALGHR
jgi:hypothetical protein